MKNIFNKSPQDMAVTRRTFLIVIGVVIVLAVFVLPRFGGGDASCSWGGGVGGVGVHRVGTGFSSGAPV